MKHLSGFAAWLVAGILLLAGPAWAQATSAALQVKDANGTSQMTCAYSQSGVLFPCHIVVLKDSVGNLHFALGDTSGDQLVSLVGTVPLPTNAVQETGGHIATIDTSTAASATSAAATTTNTGATATDIGPPGAPVCASDTGSCSLNAQVQRAMQRLTTLITAVGSPLQAGASIGNASFGISGTLPAFAATPTFNCGTGCSGSNASVGSTGSAVPTSAGLIGGGAAGGAGNLTGATVKAASTAAVATDTALVVAISPNNSLTISPTLPAGSTYQAGNCNTTANTACTMVASPGIGHSLFATAISCGNSSATSTFVNLNDSHTLQIYVPQTYGNNIVLPLGAPIQWASNTAATFSVTPAGVTTMSCNFIGYSL